MTPPAHTLDGRHWQAVDFISDLHLQSRQPATFALWRDWLLAPAPGADALIILGDLFEVWWGDEVLQPGNTGEAAFLRECAEVLRHAAQRRPVFFMAGNRDFLVGPAFFAHTGVQSLADPCLLQLGSQRLLLSHGDAWCLADADYQRFRQQVRTPAWCSAFLAQPLPEREAMATALRQQSEAQKRSGAVYADVDTATAQAALAEHQASRLIHGHTHRPADHPLPGGRWRHVLSDWDADTNPPRAEVLRAFGDGRVQRLPGLQTPGMPPVAAA